MITANGPSSTAATAPHAFVGRWKLTSEVRPTAFLIVTETGARWEGASNSSGKWEVIGNEARFTWSNRCQGILRLESGRMAPFRTDTPHETKDPPRLIPSATLRLPLTEDSLERNMAK
jgi:hypothetical protein